jgi:choline-sulfatase
MKTSSRPELDRLDPALPEAEKRGATGKHLSRRHFLKAASAGTLMLTRRSAAATLGTAPNVLILMVDEHNPMYSSTHGDPYSSSVVTPNMDRLAKMGTVYESAYCPSPLCSPSRSSFMSGRWGHDIQVYNNCNVIEFDYPSYGKVLREQGIYTAYAGKTDVYNRAPKLGFSELILAHDRALPGDTHISRHPISIRPGTGARRAKGFGVKDDPFRSDNRVMDAAEHWLSTKAMALRQPWTLTVNIVKPHFPEFVTQELWEMYPHGGTLPRYGPDQPSANHPFALAMRRFFETNEFSEADIRGLRRGYLGCVTQVDRQLGRLLDVLEGTGLLKNTVVAYTADHGEMLGKFGMWWKCSLYEDSARVPLIVAGPGFRPGTRIRTPVNTMDLQAAMFRAIGARRPSQWAGTPLQDIKPDDTNHVMFAEYAGHGIPANSYMIRKGRWKLIYYIGAPRQLFDLENDPNELKNVAGDRPDIASELERDLRKICSPEVENQRTEKFIRRQLEAIREMESVPKPMPQKPAA